jgi:hypothetical protein
MNTREIDRFVRGACRRIFQGVYSIDTLPETPVCWCVTPIRLTSRENIGWHSTSIPDVAENTLIRSVVDPPELSKTT